jgi:uncharacterized membrane protein YjjP (DUF1212 family)
MSEQSNHAKARLLMHLGKAISEAGAPAHRLESSMQVLMDKIGLHGSFFAMPTALIASLGSPDKQQAYMERITPGDINLERIVDLSEVIAELENDAISIDEALRRIDAIIKKPPAYPFWLVILSFGLASASVAGLFGGSWHDVLFSGLMGLITGGFLISTASHDHVKQLHTPLAAAVVGFLAMVIAAKTDSINYLTVSLAGLIILVPGLSFTIAIRELSTGHLVSGSARMAGAITVFLLLSFGIALGYVLGDYWLGTPPMPATTPIPEWFLMLSLLLISLSFTVLFNARLRDSIWLLLTVAVAILGSKILGQWLQQPFLAFVVVLLISVLGNLYSRYSGKPASLIHIPGVMLLVPGSVGFHSISAMLQHDTLAGIEIAFKALLIAVSIAVGLLAGNLFVPPRKAL